MPYVARMADGARASRPAGLSRPGGRTDRNRRAVAGAVLALLGEGRFDFSVADVADKAGVHRTTVYRRWPSTAALLQEALPFHTRRLRLPDSGTWEMDLTRLTTELAAFLADPVETSMNVALVAGGDPEVANVLAEHWLPIINDIVSIVNRAAARGELQDAVDPPTVVEILISPLLVRTVFLRQRPTKTFLARLTAIVLQATQRSQVESSTTPVPRASDRSPTSIADPERERRG